MSVALVRRPLSVPSAYRALSGGRDGGIAVFAGLVRPDRVGRGTVVALDYEAHVSVARRSLAQLEANARARFGLGRVVLWHRLGRIEVGAVAVIVGASAPHRDAALRGCRYLIETLKREVPIWKSDRVRPARRPRPPRRRRRAR